MKKETRDDLPEQWLMAYYDGELDEARTEQVEQWLASHSEGADSLEEYRQLDEQWQQATPDAPTQSQWDRIWEQAEEQIPDRPRISWPRGSHRSLFWGMVGTVAAMILVVLGLTLWKPPVPEPEAFPTATDDDVVIEAIHPGDQVALVTGRIAPEATLRAETEYAVVEPDDVEVVSMDASDTEAIVVGAPPVPGPFVLAAHDDITLDHLEAHADGMMPDFYVTEEGSPMLVVPMGDK